MIWSVKDKKTKSKEKEKDKSLSRGAGMERREAKILCEERVKDCTPCQSQTVKHGHETHNGVIQQAYTSWGCHYLWCPSRINFINPLRNHPKKILQNFFQYHNSPALVICTSIGTLETGAANSYFRIIAMMLICQNVNKSQAKPWAQKRLVVPCNWHFNSPFQELLWDPAFLMVLIFLSSYWFSNRPLRWCQHISICQISKNIFDFLHFHSKVKFHTELT